MEQQQSRHVALVLLCRRTVLYICMYVRRLQLPFYFLHYTLEQVRRGQLNTIQFVIVIPLNAISANSQWLLVHL